MTKAKPNLDETNTWGSIPFGTSHVQIRHLIFWLSLAAWFSLTLLVAQTQAISSLAFNLTFLINLIIILFSVRTISLTTVGLCFCLGGLSLGVVVGLTIPMQTFLHNNTHLRPFVLALLEQLGFAVPLLCLLWRGRRFSTWTLGASDILLMGAAIGAGFGFVVEAYAHKVNPTFTHFFVLLPNAEMIKDHLSLNAAVWSAMAAGTMGLAFVFHHRKLGFTVLSLIGFVMALLDHVSVDYTQLPDASPWVVSFFHVVTYNGYVALVFFALTFIACVSVDSFVQFSSLPRTPEFKILRRRDKNETLDALWDCILDLRRLAYAHYRFRRMTSRFYPVLRSSDLALTVGILAKRLINRHGNIDPSKYAGVRTGVPGDFDVALLANPSNKFPLIDLPERYELIAEVGTGGMGIIYKGRHRITGADLAIKIMHPSHSGSSSHLRRFQQEARTATTLRHANIVVVHDFGVTDRDIAYLVMEWLEGPNLEQVLKQTGSLSLDRFLHIFLQCTSALAHSHRKGIIHRDIKPSNIILCTTASESDYVKIVDFGIAKALSSEETLSLTQTGEIVGSPKYMSPEQCVGGKTDNRSDIYSLACVMYEAIVGVPALTAENQMQMFYKHTNVMPARPTLLNPNLPNAEAIERVLFRALQKDPESRYKSMEELEGDLKRIQVMHVS